MSDQHPELEGREEEGDTDMDGDTGVDSDVDADEDDEWEPVFPSRQCGSAAARRGQGTRGA